MTKTLHAIIVLANRTSLYNGQRAQAALETACNALLPASNCQVPYYRDCGSHIEGRIFLDSVEYRMNWNQAVGRWINVNF